MRFGNAIVISALFHSIIITSFRGSTVYNPIIELKKPIIVDYVEIKEMLRVEVPKTKTEYKPNETPRVDLKRPVDIKPVTAVSEESKKDAKDKKKIASDVAKKEAALKATSDYINYYQLLREKIRQKLKKNYRVYDREGDVYLIFSLSSDGSLIALDINRARSTSDSTLLGIAMRSMRESSPFPSFPKALTIPKMSFNLIASFRKE